MLFKKIVPRPSARTRIYLNIINFFLRPFHYCNFSRTCALLVERAMQPKTATYWHTEDEVNLQTMEVEECMLFVIDDDGATKIVNKKHYGEYIRRLQSVEEI